MKDCERAMEEEKNNEGFKEEELVCGSCAAVSLGGATKCKTHGNDFIEFKCKFCCSVS